MKLNVIRNKIKSYKYRKVINVIRNGIKLYKYRKIIGRINSPSSCNQIIVCFCETSRHAHAQSIIYTQ